MTYISAQPKQKPDRAESLERKLTSINEDNLLLAVLERAIRDLYSRNKYVKQSAEQWFASERRKDFYDYLVICERFEINPGRLLQKLTQQTICRQPHSRFSCHYLGPIKRKSNRFDNFATERWGKTQMEPTKF